MAEKATGQATETVTVQVPVPTSTVSPATLAWIEARFAAIEKYAQVPESQIPIKPTE